MKCSKCRFFVKTKLYGTTCGCQGVKPCEVQKRADERKSLRDKKNRKYNSY